MAWSHRTARVVVPGGEPEAEAIGRTTHLGIGAHPDDLEIMAWHGITKCRGAQDQRFTGVVVADGAGSPRAGKFEGLSDEGMRTTRLAEQTRAAEMGWYSALVYLGFPSDEVKRPAGEALAADLGALFAACRPDTVYTHNLFDAHDTHVAVALQVIRALRALPADRRPRTLYGCEVWRGLDWLSGVERVALDVSGHEELGAGLIALHASQVAGKRYDLGAVGRKRANAVFSEARALDSASAAELAVDMSPLIRDPTLDVTAFAQGVMRHFVKDVTARLRRCGA